MDIYLWENHSVKSVRIRGYSVPHFPALGLNTERYSVSFRIQSECEKMRTRITPNTDNFHPVNKLENQNNPWNNFCHFHLPRVSLVWNTLTFLSRFFETLLKLIRQYKEPSRSFAKIYACHGKRNYTHPISVSFLGCLTACKNQNNPFSPFHVSGFFIDTQWYFQVVVMQKNVVIPSNFLVRKFCEKAHSLCETVPFHKISTTGN